MVSPLLFIMIRYSDKTTGSSCLSVLPLII
nr:MAG TPA: hypothetical protein [Caudoviricetes sp.]